MDERPAEYCCKKPDSFHFAMRGALSQSRMSNAELALLRWSRFPGHGSSDTAAANGALCGSPRSSTQVRARTVAGAAQARARIRQVGVRPGKRRAMAKREVWVGIDVSKRRLDVALGVHGELLQV